MNFRIFINLLFAATFILSFAGCDFVRDMTDTVDEMINGKEKKDDGPPRSFQYISAKSNDRYGIIIDPYDGSLDLMDPLEKNRISIHTTLDSSYGVLYNDGLMMAVLDAFRSEVRLVDIASDYEVKTVIEVGETVNKLVVSPHNNFMLAIYDSAMGKVEFGDSGMINYFEVDIINLESGERKSISMDFSPDRIVFSPNKTSVLLGKEIRLIHLDLDTTDTVQYPLSLGAHDPKTPKEIRISPDGQFAMALVEGTSDVYVLDLEAKLINIFDLDSTASDILFIPETRIALLPQPEGKSIAVIDLDLAIPDKLDIGFEVSKGVLSPDLKKGLFYKDYGEIVIVMSLDDFDFKAYSLNCRLDNEISKPVSWSPDSTKLVMIGSPYESVYGNYDIDIIDLDDGNIIPLGFEGRVRTYLFSPSGATLGILLPGLQKFVRIDMELFQAESWELGRKSRNLHYIKAASAYMISYKMGRGKLRFVGDVGTDLHWVAARFLDN